MEELRRDKQERDGREREMIKRGREEEQEGVCFREEEMKDPFLEEFPSSEEDGIEMKELRRDKRERDEVER